MSDINIEELENKIETLENPEDRELAQDILKINKPQKRGKYLKEVTPKERRLIKAYIRWPDDPMKACKAAGYNPASVLSANAIVHRVRRKSEATMQKELENAELSADWIVRKIIEVVNNSKRDSDKLKALELLGKYMRMFTDKVEVSGGTVNKYELSVKDMTDAELERIIAGDARGEIEPTIVNALPEGVVSASEVREVKKGSA